MKKNSEIKNVAFYIRVSTTKQAKEGDSLEAQEQALTEFALKSNYKIVGKYIDGGESGQKLKRTNLQKLLKDCETGNIDLIIMTKLDRWFRNVSDFYKVLEVLKKNRVDWKTIWEDYDTTTASGEFWLNVSLALGQMEAKRTGERICDIFEYKFKYQKTVCSGNKKYGYDISKEKKYIINQEKAQNIIDLYDHFISTENLLETVKWFNENKENVGYASIKNYLKDISYTGKYLRKKTGELIDDFIPQIITEEKFNKAQLIFERNIKNYKTNGTYKNNYIFAGLLKCKKCGSRLSGSSNKNGNKYYRCKKYSTGSCNQKGLISEKKLEEYLLKNLSNIINKEIESTEIETNKNQQNEIKIETIKRKMNKMTELYINDMINIEYYNQEYTKLKQILEESKKIESNIETDRKKIEKINKLLTEDFNNIYLNMSETEKRKIWGEMLKYIIIDIESKEKFEIELKID